ncbi:MAG: leucine-rich repeat domain-containing protein [Actinomycetes bacterium]
MFAKNRFRITVAVFPLALLVALGNTSAQALVTGTYKGMTYSSNGTEIQITGCAVPCTKKSLVIPAKIAGKPVVGIANRAFQGDVVVTSLTVGKNVLSIGDSVFQDSILRKLTFAPGSTLRSIGNNYSFAGTALSDIVFPASLERIGNGAFGWMNDSKNASGVPTLHTVLFSYPSHLTSIGDYAFAEAVNLQVVTFTGDAPTLVHQTADAIPFKSTGTRTIGGLASMNYVATKSSWTSEVLASAGFSTLIHSSISAPQLNPTKPPKISGKAKHGKKLSGSTGTFYPGQLPETTTYQWYSCDVQITEISHVAYGCLAIENATAKTYKLISAEIGKYIRLDVMRTSDAGTTHEVTKSTSIVK